MACIVLISAADGSILMDLTKAITELPTIPGSMTDTIGSNGTDKTFNTVFYDYDNATLEDTYILYDRARNIVYHDLDMSVYQVWEYYPATPALSDHDNIWTSEASQKAIILYDNLSKVYDFYVEILGLHSYDGNHGKIFAYVNDGKLGGTNAFSSSPREYKNEIVNVLSFGGLANYQNELFVVGHEFTHSIQMAMYPCLYQGVSGALMEAYADVMGEIIESHYSNGNSMDWIGTDRNMKNPNASFDNSLNLSYPERVNGLGYYVGTQDNGGVHHNSTIISHAIYKIYEDGLNDTKQLTELLYRTWGYLAYGATFYDYRVAMLAVAKDMGLSRQIIDSINTAFDEANITPQTIPEDYDQVFSTADLYLTVLASSDNTAISTARIAVRNGNNTFSEIRCDENGYAHINLKSGQYIVTVAAVGYITQDIIYNLSPFETIKATIKLSKSNPSVYDIGGTVTDNDTGEPLGGVTLKFRKGNNVKSGRVVTTISTNQTGYFYTDDLYDGFYTVELIKAGYVHAYHVVQPASQEWDKSFREEALNQRLTMHMNTESYSTGLAFTSNGDGTCYVSGIGTCTDAVVTIPRVSPAGDRVTGIGDSAFFCCYSLKSIIILDNVTDISQKAFGGCTSLTNVVIPDSITRIADYTFAYCTALKSISIPDRVTSIGRMAFRNCTSLTSLHIPKSVKNIGEHAFLYSCNFSKISVESGNPAYHSNGNCLIDTASKTLLLGCRNSIIPTNGSITHIGEYAFANVKNLNCIVIPDSVTSIGKSTFLRCSGLTSITIPDSVSSIGDSAFCYCSDLKRINIPSGVTTIGRSAFCGCSSLTSIVIPDHVTSIGDQAFFECSSLTNVVIPNNVKSLGVYSFGKCTNLKSVTIGTGITSIQRLAFYKCSSLNAVHYKGSRRQWNAITIENGNESLLDNAIHCTDGTIK